MWDFETDPEFQKDLDWIEEFVHNEIEPLDFVVRNPYDINDPVRKEIIPPLQAITVFVVGFTQGFTVGSSSRRKTFCSVNSTVVPLTSCQVRWPYRKCVARATPATQTTAPITTASPSADARTSLTGI